MRGVFNVQQAGKRAFLHDESVIAKEATAVIRGAKLEEAVSRVVRQPWWLVRYPAGMVGIERFIAKVVVSDDLKRLNDDGLMLRAGESLRSTRQPELRIQIGCL